MKKMLFTILLIQLLAGFPAGIAGINLDFHIPVEKLGHQIDSLVMLQHAPEEPGGVIAVISSDGVLHQRVYGLMNVEMGKPVDAYTLFDIASVAKQFTAFAIMMLEGEGKLDLDADIRMYLPDLPTYAHKVTTRHLLQHTSGMPSTDVLRLLAGIPFDQIWTQDDELRLIKQYPFLNFEPNTAHLYSNAGYALLANIVEQLSGLRFQEFMDQKIFKPLGMHDSFVMAAEVSMSEKIAAGYRKRQGEFEVFSSLDDLSYGSGNLFSSLHDMIRWGQHMLMPVTGSHAFYQRISQPYNTLNNGDTLYYTYGFNVRRHKGVKMVEHSGGVPGFRNQFMVFPEADVIIMLMFNNESINTRSIATGIADIIMPGLQEAEPTPQNQTVDFNIADARAFEGRYLMPDGMEMTFVARQDTFWLELPGDMRFQLFAAENQTFFPKEIEASCTFIQSEDGSVNEMVWKQRGQDHLAKRIEEPIMLDQEELPLFTGNFYHQELQVNYAITLDNGELILHPPDTFSKYLGLETITLNHVNGDKFHSEWLGLLEFTRDEQAHINGFVMLNVGRVQHIRFLLVNN